MDAFHSLYDRSSKLVHSVVYRILRDRPAAEDAVQETYLKIWRNSARFDPAISTAISWIAVIARNTALDMIRARKPTQELDREAVSALVVEAVNPPDPRLKQCLARLPADQASAIVTMYTYGMSHSELSEFLGIPLGTVKSWVRRGTQALKECMEC